MVMGFRTEINGRPTGFAEKILDGTKIHSIRAGNRWKPGMLIHPATGVRTANYKQITPEPLRVVSVQEIYIDLQGYDIYVDKKRLLFFGEERKALIKNDGFDNAKDFFNAFKKLHGGLSFKGQIIHWTDKRY